MMLPGLAQAQKTNPQGSALERILKTKSLRVGLALLAPMAMLDKNNELIGLEVDVARRLANDLGVRLELVQTPTSDLMNGLNTDRYDLIISGYAITPERALYVNFTNPYYFTRILLVASKQAAPGKALTAFNSPGMTLGTLAGHSEIQIAGQHFPLASLRLFDREEALLNDLLDGKIPAAVVSDQLIRFNVAFHANKLYLPDDKSLSAEAVAMAVRKGDYETLTFLNNWISILHGEGWVEARRAFWYEQSSWIKNVPDI